MSEPGKYFTFPLCLLAFGHNERERLEYILCHSVMRVGFERHDTGNGETLANEYLANNPRPVGFSKSRTADVAALAGARLLNVSIADVQSLIVRDEATRRFTSDFEARHGRDALVMISTKIFGECHNEGDPPYRMFATLSAVLSVIGSKTKPTLIVRAMVRARQLGYKTPQVMAAEISKRTDGTAPLSEQQIRDALDWLELRGLIVRTQANRRHVYFSTTDDHETLIARVKAMNEAADKVASARQRERELLDRRKGKALGNHNGTTREPLKKKQPKKNHSGTTLKEGTTTEPLAEPLGEPLAEPLNQIPLIKSLLSDTFKDSSPRAREADSKAPAEPTEPTPAPTPEPPAAPPPPPAPPTVQDVANFLAGFRKGAERFAARFHDEGEAALWQFNGAGDWRMAAARHVDKAIREERQQRAHDQLNGTSE